MEEPDSGWSKYFVCRDEGFSVFPNVYALERRDWARETGLKLTGRERIQTRESSDVREMAEEDDDHCVMHRDHVLDIVGGEGQLVGAMLQP